MSEEVSRWGGKEVIEMLFIRENYVNGVRSVMPTMVFCLIERFPSGRGDLDQLDLNLSKVSLTLPEEGKVDIPY